MLCRKAAHYGDPKWARATDPVLWVKSWGGQSSLENGETLRAELGRRPSVRSCSSARIEILLEEEKIVPVLEKALSKILGAILFKELGSGKAPRWNRKRAG
jgi:hypothetical protein